MKVIDLNALPPQEGQEIIERLGIDWRTATSARDAQLAQDFCRQIRGFCSEFVQGAGYLGSTLRGTSYELKTKDIFIESDVDCILFVGGLSGSERANALHSIFRTSKFFFDSRQQYIDLQISDLDEAMRAAREKTLDAVFYHALLDATQIVDASPIFDTTKRAIAEAISTDGTLSAFNDHYREAGKHYGLKKHAMTKDIISTLYTGSTRSTNDHTYQQNLFKTREI